jgi:3-deoxy-manno-octulosonate cytidylyltransferase (CMP-KDO synthetase)
MNKIAIIIPSRLNAQRLPNKPLKLINNKEMILHVYEAAVRSKVGEVYIATPDQKIIDFIKNAKGNVVKTSNKHETGTDRIFEVFKDALNNEPDIIINLQGDMPNIKPQAISDLVSYMKQGKCDIGTLASEFKSEDELRNSNVVKVAVKEKLSGNIFLNALDFCRIYKNSKNYLYHHVGIYAFTSKALIKYVTLKRTKLELERKLEQLRALENNMAIHVGYIKSSPLSVDTEEDLIEVKKIMENKK